MNTRRMDLCERFLRMGIIKKHFNLVKNTNIVETNDDNNKHTCNTSVIELISKCGMIFFVQS